LIAFLNELQKGKGRRNEFVNIVSQQPDVKQDIFVEMLKNIKQKGCRCRKKDYNDDTENLGACDDMKKKLDSHKRNRVSPGLSIRRLHFVLAVCTLIISVLLLIATFRANHGYSAMRGSTEDYIRWQRSAYELQVGSDVLTEQVRSYAETGDRRYMDGYFEEANVTRRRDRALESLREVLGGTPTYIALEAAMERSVALMEREYYSMLLTSEAAGLAPETLPQELRTLRLSDADAALSPAQQREKARSMVFDDTYRAEKSVISEDMNACFDELVTEIGNRQMQTGSELLRLLNGQRLLIILLIVLTISTLSLTLMLVISPLLRAVVFIRADQPIPITGSNEFRFLARTYNLMYESKREQSEQLAFEATHDALTGVYNRSGYDFLMRNLDLTECALLVLDIDHFKAVNDSFGHEMGDRVLRRAAQTLSDSFRSQDYVCRIGGDEFAVILRSISPESAPPIREKLREINVLLAAGDGTLPPFSLSCGVAFGAEHSGAEELFQAADAALYRVKNNGRSGCEIAQ